MAPESAIPTKDTILIIDDSPENLRVLSKTLEAHGYSVRCVTNGLMAVATVQNSPPSLILIDIRMPGINGYEVCQQLKQNPETQEIPVIFLSALTDVQEVVKAFQVGGIDYITKPFQTEEVIARIQNQLMIQNLRRQLSEQNHSLLQEIDERKKFEQALCQEIQRRTLLEASLQDAKNAAEANNYVRSKFLAQMSHELRTPLNVILGFSSLMQDEPSLPSIHLDYLARIQESAEQLLKIINDVLAIFHAEPSQLSIEEQEFDLHALLNAVIAVWQPKANEKGLQFEFHRSPEVPRCIRSDESKVRQILMNLLDHAVRFTEQGWIKIHIGVENQQLFPLNENFRLMIEIQDTGKSTSIGGLNPILQRSAHADSDYRTVQEMGLGFLLIRQLAHLMKGDVTAKTWDQGNTVRVSLLVQLTSPCHIPVPIRLQPYTVGLIPEDESLAIEALQFAMPHPWVIQLHHAAVQGFDQKILHLLQDIPAHYTAAAKTLEIWTRNFQFDHIVEITQRMLK